MCGKDKQEGKNATSAFQSTKTTSCIVLLLLLLLLLFLPVGPNLLP